MILLFGGTTEGRVVAACLERAGQPFFYSTKGDGQKLSLTYGERVSGAMSSQDMVCFCRERGVKLLIDAAHPFAEELHSNISTSSQELKISVIRYSRSFPPRAEDIVWSSSYDEMIAQLVRDRVTKIVALTGVNTISKLRPLWDGSRDVWFRVMEREESLAISDREEFPRDRLLFFDDQDNRESKLSRIEPQAILTKESGSSGFFERKVEAAREMGIAIYAIKRPELSEEFIVVDSEDQLEDTVRKSLPGFFPLRSGFTTGACATAATKAALHRLRTGIALDQVSITLPKSKGEETTFAVDWSFMPEEQSSDISLPEEHNCDVTSPKGQSRDASLSNDNSSDTLYSISQQSVTAAVKKYSGDDPDVTHGLYILSTVSKNRSGNITFLKGEGVGTITLEGFDAAVGEPAINRVPREMMLAVTKEEMPNSGVDITISVPEGRVVAKRTFNPKLGIVGGISILGTSGIVKPFSKDAWVHSIYKEIDVAKANGCNHIVLNSGSKSERFLKDCYPDYPNHSFVQYGNFIGDTVARADRDGIANITVGVMLGKAVKLAEGHLNTHSKKVVMNRDFIAMLAKEANYPEDKIASIGDITLASHLWDLFGTPLLEVVRKRCVEVCKSVVNSSCIEILLISPKGEIYSGLL